VRLSRLLSSSICDNIGYMNKLAAAALLLTVVLAPMCATSEEDEVSDVVAAAFAQARQDAHLSKLERMGRNIFREKVCKHDMRFASGLILDVVYQTSEAGHIPESARRLAVWPDTSKTAARFGVGVCSLSSTSPGSPQYSVLIATYESRIDSFWRFFWD
jgi:hypothetical protein